MDEGITKFVQGNQITDRDFGDIVLHRQLKEASKTFTDTYSIQKIDSFYRALQDHWNSVKVGIVVY